MKTLFCGLLIVSTLPVLSQVPHPAERLEVPGRDSFAVLRPGGISVLPSGRFVKPAGRVHRITHDPFGLTVSPDGRRAVALHNGVLTIIQLDTDSVIRVPGYDSVPASPFPRGSLLGASFHPDGRTVFLSCGDAGTIIAYDCERLAVVDSFRLDGPSGDSTYRDSFTSDLLYNGRPTRSSHSTRPTIASCASTGRAAM